MEMCRHEHEKKDDDVNGRVTKKAWIAPAGKCVNLSPVDHTFQVRGTVYKSKEYALHPTCHCFHHRLLHQREG